MQKSLEEKEPREKDSNRSDEHKQEQWVHPLESGELERIDPFYELDGEDSWVLELKRSYDKRKEYHRHYQLARYYLENDDTDKAKNHLEQALTYAPGELEKTMVNDELKNIDLSIHNKSLEQIKAEGFDAYNEGNYKEADQFFSTALKMENTDPDLLFMRGACYHNLAKNAVFSPKRQKEYIELSKYYLDQAIQLNPNEHKYYSFRSSLHSLNGDYLLAEEDIKRAIELAPHHQGYADRLENMSFKLKPAYKDEGIRLMESADAHYGNGEFALANGMYLDALKYLDRVGERLDGYSIDRQRSHAYKNLGNMNWVDGNLELAKLNFDLAVKHNPYDSQLYRLRGSFFVYLNDWDSAAKDLKKALGDSPKDANLNRLYSSCLQNLGDLEKAKEHLLIAENNTTDNPALTNKIDEQKKILSIDFSKKAFASFKDSDHRSAKDDFESAYLLDEYNRDASYGLALSLSKVAEKTYFEDIDDAIDLYEQSEAIFLKWANDGNRDDVEKMVLWNGYYGKNDLGLDFDQGLNSFEIANTRSQHASLLVEKGFLDEACEQMSYAKNSIHSRQMLEKYANLSYEYIKRAQNFDNSGRTIEMAMDDYQKALQIYDDVVHDIDDIERQGLEPGLTPSDFSDIPAVSNNGLGVLHYRLSKAIFSDKPDHLEKSLRYFDEAISFDNTNPVFYLNRGHANLRAKNIDDATEDFLEVLEFDDGNVEAHRQLADIFYDLNDYFTYEHHLRRCISLEPDRQKNYFFVSDLGMLSRKYHHLAKDYLDSDRYSDVDFAGSLIQRATDIKPKDEDYQDLENRIAQNILDFAYVDYHLKDYGAAIEKSDRCLELDDKIASAYGLKGSIYHIEYGDYENAFANFANYIRLADADDELKDATISLRSLASSAFSRGVQFFEAAKKNEGRQDVDSSYENYIKSIENFNIAIDSYDLVFEHADPNSSIGDDVPHIYYHRGLAFDKIGEPEKALSDINTSLSLKEDFSACYLARAVINMNMGRLEDAKRDCNKVIDLLDDEQDSEFLITANFGLAEIYLQTSDHIQAIKYYQNTADLLESAGLESSDHAYCHYQLSQLKESLGYPQEQILGHLDISIKHYEVHDKDSTTLQIALFHRSEIYSSRLRYSGAIKDLSSILQIDPDNFDAYVRRSGYLQILGENHLAVADLNRAIEIHPSNMEAYLYRADALRSILYGSEAGRGAVDATAEEQYHFVLGLFDDKQDFTIYDQIVDDLKTHISLGGDEQPLKEFVSAFPMLTGLNPESMLHHQWFEKYSLITEGNSFNPMDGFDILRSCIKHWDDIHADAKTLRDGPIFRTYKNVFNLDRVTEYYNTILEPKELSRQLALQYINQDFTGLPAYMLNIPNFLENKYHYRIDFGHGMGPYGLTSICIADFPRIPNSYPSRIPWARDLKLGYYYDGQDWTDTCLAWRNGSGSISSRGDLMRENAIDPPIAILYASAYLFYLGATKNMIDPTEAHYFKQASIYRRYNGHYLNQDGYSKSAVKLSKILTSPVPDALVDNKPVQIEYSKELSIPLKDISIKRKYRAIEFDAQNLFIAVNLGKRRLSMPSYAVSDNGLGAAASFNLPFFTKAQKPEGLLIIDGELIQSANRDLASGHRPKAARFSSYFGVTMDGQPMIFTEQQRLEMITENPEYFKNFKFCCEAAYYLYGPREDEIKDIEVDKRSCVREAVGITDNGRLVAYRSSGSVSHDKMVEDLKELGCTVALMGDSGSSSGIFMRERSNHAESARSNPVSFAISDDPQSAVNFIIYEDGTNSDELTGFKRNK